MHQRGARQQPAGQDIGPDGRQIADPAKVEVSLEGIHESVSEDVAKQQIVDAGSIDDAIIKQR